VPSLVFVDRPGDADIPISWESKAPRSAFAGVAYCQFDIDFPTRRFGVQNVGVTAWDRDGTQVSVDDLHRTLLHEMGHALGIADHSRTPKTSWTLGSGT
jgi:predicted Zn-dependent protease